MKTIAETWPDPQSPFRQLSKQAANCLIAYGLTTAEEVQTASDAQLMSLPNMGRRYIAQIRAVLPYVGAAA